MEPCYMCQRADNDDYLTRSPCNCESPMRIHLRCYVHVLDSICAACGAQMKPVIVDGKGRVAEFIDLEDSSKYLHYYIDRNLTINGILTQYHQGYRVAKYTYKNSILDGKSITYNKDGTISKIEYHHGSRHK